MTDYVPELDAEASVDAVMEHIVTVLRPVVRRVSGRVESDRFIRAFRKAPALHILPSTAFPGLDEMQDSLEHYPYGVYLRDMPHIPIPVSVHPSAFEAMEMCRRLGKKSEVHLYDVTTRLQ